MDARPRVKWSSLTMDNSHEMGEKLIRMLVALGMKLERCKRSRKVDHSGFKGSGGGMENSKGRWRLRR
ncbi:hypothetical protein H5410_028125 [Solanum commersonii]|uniref:Uncharacterized protein n=1 Tax=Solanum commersonii TaxID=4109 RepID=A0A9J5Z166_SOLCO|nr:hypothetical protein H5410_028125 [Solanum commersonii]